LAQGIGASILSAIVARAASLDLPPDPVVTDLGCGGGDALAALAARRPIRGVGIDLSAAAIARAVKQPGELTWVVANADRRLPLLDASVHLLLSLNARRNPVECARVLTPDGVLVVAVPAPEDLVELRERVQGARITRDRAHGVMDEHARAFQLVSRESLRERHTLEGALLRDLLAGTYRGARTREHAQASSLEALEVTLASDLLIFSRGESRPGLQTFPGPAPTPGR
jgi:23S rRNA (guanine745-N1)-methyltransferase